MDGNFPMALTLQMGYYDLNWKVVRWWLVAFSIYCSQWYFDMIVGDPRECVLLVLWYGGVVEYWRQSVEVNAMCWPDCGTWDLWWFERWLDVWLVWVSREYEGWKYNALDVCYGCCSRFFLLDSFFSFFFYDKMWLCMQMEVHCRDIVSML